MVGVLDLESEVSVDGGHVLHESLHALHGHIKSCPRAACVALWCVKLECKGYLQKFLQLGFIMKPTPLLCTSPAEILCKRTRGKGAGAGIAHT